jgi:hypothetical protein
VNAVPARAVGHALDAELAWVRVSAASREAYLACGADDRFAPNTLIAESLNDPTSGRLLRVFVMRKSSAHAWAFATLSTRRTIEVEPSDSLCARCHAEAPCGSVFGLPIAATK